MSAMKTQMKPFLGVLVASVMKLGCVQSEQGQLVLDQEQAPRPEAETLGQSAQALVTGNKSMYFNGTNAYVNLGLYAPVPSSTFTAEAWLYPTGTTDGIIVGNEGRFLLGRTGDGRLRYAVHTGGSYAWNVTEAVAPYGKWTHVALVLRANAVSEPVKLYVDGVGVDSEWQSGVFSDAMPSHNETRIGSRQYCTTTGCTGSEYFNGYIDEVRFWNTARTESDIRAWMSRRPSAGPSLSGEWRLDETSGSVLDTSDQDIHGTVVGTPMRGTLGVPMTSLSTVWFGGHTYIFKNLPKIFVDAKADCEAEGFKLISVDNAAEQAFLESRPSQSAYGRYIGLNDRASLGVWKWADNSNAAYSVTSVSAYRQWSSTPSSAAPNSCVAYTEYTDGLYTYVKGRWMQANCDAVAYYTCENL